MWKGEALADAKTDICLADGPGTGRKSRYPRGPRCPGESASYRQGHRIVLKNHPRVDPEPPAPGVLLSVFASWREPQQKPPSAKYRFLRLDYRFLRRKCSVAVNPVDAPIRSSGILLTSRG